METILFEKEKTHPNLIQALTDKITIQKDVVRSFQEGVELLLVFSPWASPIPVKKVFWYFISMVACALLIEIYLFSKFQSFSKSCFREILEREVPLSFQNHKIYLSRYIFCACSYI